MAASEAPEPVHHNISQTDRSLAAGVHVASIIWPLLGPIIGWVVFRTKPFVAAHAKQALLETLVIKVGLFLALVLSTAYTITRIIHFTQTNWADFSWQEFLLRFVVGWAAVALLGFFNTVMSVMQALKAYRGRWPNKRALAKVA